VVFVIEAEKENVWGYNFSSGFIIVTGSKLDIDSTLT
jgi:hypothetical protein